MDESGDWVDVDVGGYVLAGGRSSRMRTDKALLRLAGRPLIAHAVSKLRRVLSDVQILAGAAPGNPALAEFAPLVFDMHPGCGPIGGIESALMNTAHEWNLIVPVDVPFLPAALLAWWIKRVQSRGAGRCFVATFQLEELPQPALLMIHRAVAPRLAEAIARGSYKLFPVLEQAARELAPPDARADEAVPYVLRVDEQLGLDGWEQPAGAALSEEQRHAPSLWFANLNTPEEFAEAQGQVEALDPVP